MKVISFNDLNLVDPLNDVFIIKNSFPKNKCEIIKNFLLDNLKAYKENQRINNFENWYYRVHTNNNNFFSFIFNDLNNIKCPELKDAFKKIYEIHYYFGNKTDLENFYEDIKINSYETQIRTINPFVFLYPSDEGIFHFHKHDIRVQKFQLLMNITLPYQDYEGGETIIYTGGDIPNDKNITKDNSIVIDNENFSQGDIFSFPYDKWHKVNSPKKVSQDSLNMRISLLMPIGKRRDKSAKNKTII